MHILPHSFQCCQLVEANINVLQVGLVKEVDEGIDGCFAATFSFVVTRSIRSISELCKLLGITKTRTTPYHPQSDGMIERFNRTLLSMLSTVLGEEGEENWEVALPAVMLVALIRQHTNLHSC